MPRHPGFIRSARMRLVGTTPPDSIASGGDLGAATEAADLVVPAPRPSMSIYRPLIVGAAILHRLPGSLDPRRRWQVDVAPGGRFLPDAPAHAVDVEHVVDWRRRSGEPCRAGAALVASTDLSPSAPSGTPQPTAGDDASLPLLRFANRDRGLRRGAAIEMYGWALMYQFPGADHRAWVDPHEDHDDLPAFFESPLELLDRATFLAARGVRTRPIALITRPDDFLDARQGPVNRFFPASRFRRPADLRRLF